MNLPLNTAKKKKTLASFERYLIIFISANISVILYIIFKFSRALKR